MFGAEFVLMNGASGLSAGGDGLQVTLSEGGQVSARAVVLATGVSYRQLDAPGLAGLVGAGVFYGSALSEAPAVKDQDVFIVAPGTPPGRPRSTWPGRRAALRRWCAGTTWPRACPTTSSRRSKAPPGSMCGCTPRSLRPAATTGSPSWSCATGPPAATSTVSAAALFAMIGATPHTDWLPAMSRATGTGSS